MALLPDKSFLKAIKEALKSGEIIEMAEKFQMAPQSISRILRRGWQNEEVINEAYGRAVHNIRSQLSTSKKARILAKTLNVEV